MSRNLLTTLHFLFLAVLLLGQSQLGFGQSEEEIQEEEEEVGPVNQIPKAFTAVSSHFFTPGSDYKVFLTVDPHPNNESLQLKCVVMSNSSHSTTIESAPISLRPGESGPVSIPMPEDRPGGETTWRLFAWSFTEKSEKDGYRSYAPHTLIVSRKLPNPDFQSAFKFPLHSVFVQTDKPAYKPEDLVRIRVITMGSNDLPHLTAGVNMTITDSQGNVMKKWEQPLELPESASLPSNVSSSGNGSVALFGEFQKKKHGLSSYEFQLSDEPILGNWTIQVEAGNIKEKMYFDVKKYILPKFQVKVKVPPVLYGTKDLTTSATIQVSYTYGKGLQGTGNVTVTSSNDVRTAIQQIVVKDGEATVPIKLSGSQNAATVHTITANVTEKNTDRWRIGKATVRIYPRETYFVQWINKPDSYKSGLPLTVTLKITGADGYPVKEVRPNALRISFPSSSKPIEKEASIPPSGIVSFTFPTPLQPLHANSKFQVEYKKTSYNNFLPTAAPASSSGIFIEVAQPPDSSNLLQGNSYNFTILSNKPIQPEFFQCLLWDDAAMEVHGAQTIINNQSEPATEFPFSLQLPKGAYTDLKVFVYYETHDERIVSTFKSINTHNYLKIRVSRPIPKKAPEINNSTEASIPGESSTLAPSPDAPLETTSAATTITTTTTASSISTATEEIDYAYGDDQRDDPGVEEAAEPEPQISDKLQVEPGDAVEIHFETYPDSTIAIRGIDQSLLLLTEQDNDLDREKVESKRASASTESRKSQLDNIPADNSSSTFFKAFNRVGISILNSNAYSPYVPPAVGGISFKHGLENDGEVALSPDNPVVDDSRIPRVDSRLRTKFPETWLWEEFESSNDSFITTLSKTLPDTLTSWIISGFSLNPKTGLGVASPATITGFMPFFITLNLPYSVVKYESFELQVIVHNYLDRDVDVWVNLFNRHNNFSFIDSRELKAGNASRYVKVKKDHVAVAHFVITPTVIGDIPIEVSAVTEDGTAADSMLRPLKVKPDGMRYSRTQLVIFSRPKAANGNMSRNKTFEVVFPQKVVTGGSSLQLTVIGDPMGTLVTNLGNLLRVPYGCGEQNMIVFVPNILALHYLSATNSDAKDTMKRATSLLEQGYGHQLQYKMKDGSFAVWKQNAGSTWLTAYVVQWFVVAQEYITIDQKVIQGAINFIRSKQARNGSFVETGVFYHPEMRGRTGAGGVALTAYITLALIKANQTSQSDLELKKAIEDGMRFISRQSVYDLDDNYITNLVAATLMAGGHPEKTRFFDKMEKAANTTTTEKGVKLKYWDMINQRARATTPLAIEMTSYALLAHIWRTDKTDSSVPNIYKWLLNQRNPQGGFISTQDTNMGLTALTEYALKTVGNVRDKDELHLNIRASPNSEVVKDTEFPVSVARWNRMVLQEFRLPVNTKVVHMSTRGSGSALVQLTETWHVPIGNVNRPPRWPKDHFDITATMAIPDPEYPSTTELTFCVNSFHLNGAKDSIAAIELPSGYAFEQEDFEADSNFMARRPKNVQRFEVKEGNSKLDVYYDYIQADRPTCLTLVALRLNAVANGKKKTIVVYEYVNPEVKGTVSYLPAHRINVCQLCKTNRACDQEDCE